MNSLARLVTPIKWAQSRRFLTTVTAFESQLPLRHRPSILPLSFSKQLSPSLNIPIASFATANDPKFPKMDPNPPESGEEFVHVDPLSQSLVSLGDEVRDDSSDAEETSGAVPEETKKELPEELSKSVVILTCDSSADGGTCDVYLVGTAHVSTESCREVQAIIDFLKPQVVFLELCSSRVPILTPQNLKVPTFGEMVEMWKKKQNTFGIIYSWFLAKVASKLAVFPGSEFRVAYEEAMKYGGKVILGDRPVQITLRRTWGNMPLWHKIKLLYSFLFQAFFLPSPKDLNRMLLERGTYKELRRIGSNLFRCMIL